MDKIKAVLGNSPTAKDELTLEFEQVIADSEKEIQEAKVYGNLPTVAQQKAYKEQVSGWSKDKKILFAKYLIHTAIEELKKINSHQRKYYNFYNNLHFEYLSQIFRTNLSLKNDDVQYFVEVFSKHNIRWNGIMGWPVGLMVNQIDREHKDQPISKDLAQTLADLKKKIEHSKDATDTHKVIRKLDDLIFAASNPDAEVKPVVLEASDELAMFINRSIGDLPKDERTIWFRLLAQAQKATGSKPTKKFLSDSKVLLKELGYDKFKSTAVSFFDFAIKLKETETIHEEQYNGQTYRYYSYVYLAPTTTEVLKGIVWMCAHFHDKQTLHTIARLAERSYKKMPGVGPAAAAVGNACLYTLYTSKGLDGIGHLSRLKLRVKQANTRKQIEKYIIKTAEQKGISIHQIEDISVDDLGLINGYKEVAFGEYTAQISITGIGKTALVWVKEDGKTQKSVPKSVKDKDGAKLKKLKNTIKQINQTTVAQRDRLDRMLRTERLWSWEEFNDNYLNHGLLSYLVSNLIWNVGTDTEKVTAIYHKGRWQDLKGQEHDAAGKQISLWHPAESTVDEVEQWRLFLLEHEVQQPFKQAYREVYILTDAEINTQSYSNRMAAHLLRQHQFSSLAASRGWKYNLMGGFDNGFFIDGAILSLPEYGLQAEFWVNEVNANDAMNETGIWLYVSTDQVRFVRTEDNEIVNLKDIPKVLFSEVMRDVDLFVGVASVGNDPTWQDSGGIPAYRNYWTNYSFGDLSEMAKSRKTLLEKLVPRLKIRDVATVTDKFLVVQGKLRTYKIHIGSTNILMEPNDQYLCIVPDRKTASTLTEGLFLPFEGDSGFSVILSKAFLLAEDDKITDTTITSQIKR